LYDGERYWVGYIDCGECAEAPGFNEFCCDPTYTIDDSVPCTGLYEPYDPTSSTGGTSSPPSPPPSPPSPPPSPPSGGGAEASLLGDNMVLQ
jgi:hypothetical protein